MGEWGPDDPGTPAAGPSSFAGNGSGPNHGVAAVEYNPETGAYMAPDGHMYHQSNLAASNPPRSWTDLMPGPA
jgi:phospholipid/cholesterol/gamma-HCH transport system substrate-binding protein